MRIHRFSCLPRQVSSLMIFVFLFALIGSIGTSVFLSPPSAEAQGYPKGFLHRHDPLVREAIEVQHRHIGNLMRIRDVVGTGVGIGPDGLPAIKVFTARHGVPGIPEWLESVPVQVEVTGMIVALEDTTARYRPAPIGVSTGHPAITAGTIGARVKDEDGTVYALSNNHVYANSNDAKSIKKDGTGDSALQPGPYDGASDTSFYQIGKLYDFEPIIFGGASNTMDAAIVEIFQPADEFLINSTLEDDYGTPNSETVDATVGLPVKKYGRTTGLTHGQVSEINVTVNVCYEQWWIFCLKSAIFVDQIGISGISPVAFSAGGDSGSLIVTEQGNNPVGLLFAGSSTRTIANPIDPVLQRFGVTIDGGGTVENIPPTADFSYTTAELTVSFKDKSTDSDGTVVGWNWDFGDGSATSTVQNPVHTYTASGIYIVTLTVMDNEGDEDTKSQTLTVGVVPPAEPSGLTAKAVSRSQINLAWTDNANNEDGFKIERCKGRNCTNFGLIATIGGPNVKNYSDKGLSRITTYRYRVRAYNAAGNSGYSNIASATTKLFR
jgi:PKD repeat protein